MSQVFISYAKEDESVMKEIAGLLKSLDVQFFVDEKDVPLGSHIDEQVRKGMADSTHLVVIISPSSIESNWVQYEIGIAKTVGLKILPFLKDPSIDVPEFIRPLKWTSKLDDIREYFEGSEPGEGKDVIDSPRSKSGFVTLEPYDENIFTPKVDAGGTKELQLSLRIGGEYPYYVSHYIVKTVRSEGFDREKYENFVDIFIRVGSRTSEFIRGKKQIPLDARQVTIDAPLVPDQGWFIGETKQFYATTGPKNEPTKYYSAPLTVKRMQ